ncbi:hypothetical protein N7533_009843 [Penicillium manginii]|uniref:uncharacterized protein n=1 Tax=Penicillium manginii TaxID=203109 RepID=UPI002548FD58|nr:uncharacterized protein N7533_009843 [Penicillium manginii]KAJ5744973.1 hypothetical protein N7533_009843 [Penicillium manginii]
MADKTTLDANAQSRFDLINENLAEIMNPEIIKGILAEGKNPRVYWGTACTGRPHTGYLVPAIKIAQLLAADCQVVVLLADIHAFLDNLKAPIELVNARAEYYRKVITALLQAVGVKTDKLEFVLGSSYQKSPEYIMDVYKLSSVTSEHDAKKAGAEIVKQSSNAPLSGLLYSILQVLDEEYLNCDVELGGLDQRKLFAAAVDWLPKIGYRKRASVFSLASSKIDLLDNLDVVSKKIRKAEAAPKIVEDNGLISMVEFTFLPVSSLKGKKEFRCPRKDEEDLVYSDIESLKTDYANDILTPQILKAGVTAALTELMGPIQAAFEADKEWQEINLRAYPPPEKKQKKIKDRGSRHPGAKKPEEAANEQDLPERPKA